jgi:hypothetical protein
VRSPAAARNISGEAIISQPEEWCSAPEFVEAERIDLFDEIEIATELQQGILADRMMRSEEGSELQACHGVFSRTYCSLDCSGQLGVGKARQSSKPGCPRMVVAQS